MHYESEYTPGGLYRSRRGLIFGVCRGFADRFNLSVLGIRIVVVVAFLLTGFWPVGAAYLLAALLMRREPAYAYASAGPAWADGGSCESRSRRWRNAGDLEARLRRAERAARRDSWENA